MIGQEYLKRFTERMKSTRSRLLCRHPFFGVLMMNLRLGVEEGFPTACTNGELIVFGPDFADRLSDEEFDFVVMHELMHVALDHVSRGLSLNRMLFNIACDIVVNSSIMEMLGVTEFEVDGASVMHLVPDGSEGCLYTAEEVYHMLLMSGDDCDSPEYHIIDVHDHWNSLSEAQRDRIREIVRDAAETVKCTPGSLPAGLERSIGTIHKASLDWKQILADFIQEDMLDYSFSSPDRRYDGDLILPDLVRIESMTKNVLFMIDTSASMSKMELTAAYSEICAAIVQFDGCLHGLLGFFDAEVTPPVPFESVDDVLAIRPIGDGGTSVDVVFDYVRDNMGDNPPSSIVILTDGYTHIPPEKSADGIPVLWLFTTRLELPQWGSGAYLELPFDPVSE